MNNNQNPKAWIERNRKHLNALWKDYLSLPHIKDAPRAYNQTDDEFLPFLKFSAFLYNQLFMDGKESVKGIQVEMGGTASNQEAESTPENLSNKKEIRVANHFEVIRQFIYETGKEKGSVSGDMALQSLKTIEDELNTTDKLLDERRKILDAIPACVAHGDQCIPHALEWLDQVKTLAKVLAG